MSALASIRRALTAQPYAARIHVTTGAESYFIPRKVARAIEREAFQRKAKP